MQDRSHVLVAHVLVSVLRFASWHVVHGLGLGHVNGLRLVRLEAYEQLLNPVYLDHLVATTALLGIYNNLRFQLAFHQVFVLANQPSAYQPL